MLIFRDVAYHLVLADVSGPFPVGITPFSTRLAGEAAAKVFASHLSQIRDLFCSYPHSLGDQLILERQQWENMGTFLGRESVSYTHLDVYKRQWLRRAVPRS